MTRDEASGHVLRREVGASEAAFLRDLAKAWPPGVEESGAGRVRLIASEPSLEVEFQCLPARRLGSLVLPRLDVTYRFGPGEPAVREALLARLDRAMQRGGG